MIYFELFYWLLALGISLFYAIFAVRIFSVESGERPKSWHFHQCWLNFVGCIFGWIAMRATFDICESGICLVQSDLRQLILVVIAFLGITGYLPAFIVGSMLGFGGATARLFELILNFALKK